MNDDALILDRPLSAAGHGTAVTTRVYVWKHVFILQGRGKFVDRSERPNSRLAVSLFVAQGKPMRLKANGEPMRDYHAVVFAPGVRREVFDGSAAEYTIVDIDIAHPAYEAIEPLLKPGEVLELPRAETRCLQNLLGMRFLQPLPCAEVHTLFDRAVTLVSGTARWNVRRRDRRVYKALELIEQRPLDELSLGVLAQHTFLSESRLRHLFREEMGCTVSQYIRWACVHKAFAAWKPGMPFSEATAKAGFYDPAHFNHAVRDHFAQRPSAMLKDNTIQVRRCEC
ncbi:MAG: AraC family transcriptional regulator [Nevskia sp.]|nr:AraC family transcriptional regulator [Nevskia sp.]